ncbi:DUF3999 family protein [bacterium]|nr:DUF3999 family protein [bacterium]
MFLKKVFLASFLFIALPIICLASFSLENWQYSKEIDFSRKGLIKFSLDKEVFVKSKKDLIDLRVVNNKNEEVPYHLLVNESSKNIEKYTPQLLNNTFVSGEKSSVIADMGMGGKIINQIEILTDSKNFQRNVNLSGSNDMNKWETLLSKAYIYDYTDYKGDLKVRDTSLNFGDSVFKYYRVEIDDPLNDPVEIKGVRTVYYEKKEAEKIELEPIFDISENEDKKETEVILDLESSGILIDELSLEVDNDNFNRGVYIYTSNDKKDWKYRNNGYIFRYDTDKFKGKKLKLNFSEIDNRYIKIIIKNKDNNPLKINSIKVFSVVREIVFQTEVGKSYKLFYGNSKASPVEYDLEKYFSYLDESNFIKGELSSQEENPSFVAPKEPLTERIPYLLPGVLLAICAVLLFFIFKFLKK